jgi:hypothetical protein
VVRVEDQLQSDLELDLVFEWHVEPDAGFHQCNPVDPVELGEQAVCSVLYQLDDQLLLLVEKQGEVQVD